MIDPEKIWRSSRLPTLPSVAVELLGLSKDPDAEITDFARVIRSDPAMSAKLIKAANSSYFGMSSQVSSIEAAILVLGSTAVTSLALSFSLIAETDKGHGYRDLFESYWSRSVLQAVTAELLATKCRTGHPAECFLSGLLCDIGVLAQLCAIPIEYSEVLEAAREARGSLLAKERELLGFDHIEIGVRLMEQWRLPDLLVRATRYHHASAAELDRLTDRDNVGFLRTVNFAACVGEFFKRDGSVEAHEQVRQWAQDLLGLNDESLTALLEEVRSRTDDAARLMAINTRMIPQPSELLALANSELAEIALREHAAKSQVAVKSTALEMENRNLKQQNLELNKQVDIDGLTGVYNRRAFDQVFRATISQCLRDGRTAGVIFADLDHFKNLNDTYGHAFGDEVLRRVAKILLAQVRESDFVARYGGEEFVIVTANCSPEVVQAVAERIRSRVSAESFGNQGRQVSVTVSIGACVTPSPATAHLTVDVPELMLQQADEAMYLSKRSGRNRINVTRCSDVPVPSP